MKLIVLSDTHLKTGVIPSQLQALLEECDLIVHAGDFNTLEAFQAFNASGKLKAVLEIDDTSVTQKVSSQKAKLRS